MRVVKDCRDDLVFFADLEKTGEITGKLELNQIVFKFESDYEYITNTKSVVTFRTNKNAPNYRLINIDFNNPAEENWKTLIAEHPKNVLDWATCVDDNKLVLGYIDDVKSRLQVNLLDNGEQIKVFPLNIGSIVAFSGDKKYSEIFYQFVSFLTPGIIYHYDFKNANVDSRVFREVKLNLDGFKPEAFNVEQIFYDSKDGTKIPMFIIEKKCEKRTPKPCLLYGYGGFNVSIQPTFSITGLLFIDLFNGIMAFPNIRGGGEYGEKWHNDGRLLNKQNVFDDFQTAAEYLISNQYTEKKNLVIQGESLKNTFSKVLLNILFRWIKWWIISWCLH